MESAPGRDWPNHDRIRFERTGRLSFAILQEGAGPDLLLLHGVGGSTHCWAPLISRLASQWRVTALDLPGHGFTDEVPDVRLTLDAMSEDVGALLDQLGLAPEVVVGHSAGAGLAMRMVLDGRISPRVLCGVNPSLVPPQSMPMPAVVEALARPFVMAGAFAQFWSWVGRRPAMLDRILDSTGSRITGTQKACYRQIAASPRHVHAALTMMAQWDSAALSSGFPEVAGRVGRHLLLAGTRDRWIPLAELERVAARIPGAELQRLDMGHLGPEENPAAIAHVLVTA